jgi:hypothetical protein
MSGFEQGQDTVGKVATFMICGWFLLESAMDRFLGVDLSHLVLRPKPNAHRMYVQDQVVIHTARM